MRVYFQLVVFCVPSNRIDGALRKKLCLRM